MGLIGKTNTFQHIINSPKVIVSSVMLLFVLCVGGVDVYAQTGCDPNTPTDSVDLSTNADSLWISENIRRNGNCCDTKSPDRCLEFIITLSEDAEGFEFDIYEGAEPDGSAPS